MARDILLGTTRRDWSIGDESSWYNTPTEDVDASLNSLLVDTDNLNADITRWFGGQKQHDSASSAFVNAWLRWRDANYKFIKSWKSGAFYKIKIAWNFLNKSNERLRELAEWRIRWEEISHEKTSAPSTKPPKKDEQPWVSPLTLALTVGGVTSLALLISAIKK